MRQPVVQDREQDDGLQPCGDGDGQGDAGEAEGSDEDHRERAVDGDRSHARGHRRDGVLTGVEGPGKHRDHGVGGEPDDKAHERRCDQIEIRGADPAATEQDLDDRLANDRREDRDRDHDVREQAQGTGQEPGKGALPTDRGVARQGWQEDDAERDTDDAERDLEDRECEVEVRHGSVAKQARERRDDDERDLGHPEADRARRHQDERLARLGIGTIDARLVPEPKASHRPELDEEVSQRPGDHGQGESFDAQARPKDEGPHDDREVIDDRRHGRCGEPPARVQEARRDGAEGKEDRAQQHDPSQLDRPIELGTLEARGDDRDDDRGEDEQADRQHDQAKEHEIDDGRDDPPGPGSLVRGEQSRHDRDEGGRQGACRHELEDEVRDPERREERIEVGGAERVGDDDDPNISQDPRHQVRGRDDQPGTGEGAARAHRAGSRRARGWASR